MKVGNVVLDETEIGIAGEMPNVGRVAGDQIVDGNDAVTFAQQPVGKVRSEKTSATSNNGDRFFFAAGHFGFI